MMGYEEERGGKNLEHFRHHRKEWKDVAIWGIIEYRRNDTV
jgi:hypothetical protein